MTYYTIFLGEKPWENVVDDMNASDIWAIGGVFWDSKIKAVACMEDLKKPVYGFEDERNKFHIVSFTI